jgi:hypothetical protein
MDLHHVGTTHSSVNSNVQFDIKQNQLCYGEHTYFLGGDKMDKNYPFESFQTSILITLIILIIMLEV